MRIEQDKVSDKPQEGIKKEKVPRRKKRKWLKRLIILVIILAIPLSLVGASGIFHIPVVSHLFGANKPKDLGVEVSEEALESGLRKFPVELGEVGTLTGLGNKELKGSVELDAKYTSEEITSAIDYLFQNAPHVKDIQVKYIEGGMEVSAFAKTYLNAPVYAKVAVEKTSNKSIAVDIEKLKIGIVPIPEKYYDDVSTAIEDIVNSRMAKRENFRMEELEYHDGYSYLKGTFPKSVKALPGEQELF